MWSVGCSELTWPLRQKWFWMLFLTLFAMLVGAFLVLYLVVSLSPPSVILMLVVVFVVWFVFRSYRKWVAGRSGEECGRQEQ